MNQGAGAGRDDDDLPLVDVVVPDDARELFRDVLAYHRELRALRHRERWLRIAGPFRRRGMVLPLAAAIMLFALMAGVVLSVLSSGPYFSGGAGAGQAAAGPPATPTTLPAIKIKADGTSVPLAGLTAVALALVPAGCGCQSQLQRLITQAGQTQTPLYLVGSQAQAAALGQLAATGAPGQVYAATDPTAALAAGFRPAGLTVLLVDSRGAVTVRRSLAPGFNLEPALTSLRGAG